MPDVFIATPTTRDFSIQYVSSLWQTRIHGAAHWTAVGGQAIDIARNLLIKSFLKSGMDYLMMHDSDATWHPDAIDRLLSRNLPVVTAIIFKRGLPTVPTIGKLVGVGVTGAFMYGFADTMNKIVEKCEREHLAADTPNELLFDATLDDIQEIDGCGAHFCMIRRDVLEAIGDSWYQETSTNGGEDFAFCRKVQQAGFKLYADYSVFTGHVVGPGVEIGVREFMLFRDKVKIDVPWEV